MHWLVVCWFISSVVSESKLQFNKDGKFKIVQFTDLHFGSSRDTDIHTLAVQGSVLTQENPDLVVITGDLVSGYLWNGNDTNWYHNNWIQLIQPMVSRNIKYVELKYHYLRGANINKSLRWAIALGNHDVEADLTGEQVIALDSSHDLSLTQHGPNSISGSGNYHLSIHKNASDDVGYIWMFDSGQYDCLGVKGYGCIDTTQISWYKNESQYATTPGRVPVPGIAFFRILLSNLWNSFEVYGDLDEAEGVCCSSVNTGMYNAMKEMDDIKHVFCGHDHKNDYYGDYYGITLGYGRKTGYGKYGPPLDFKRGARVIEISENGEVETWLRLEDKSKVIQSFRTGWPSQYVGCCKMEGHGKELSHIIVYSLFGAEGGLLVIGLIVVKLYRRYKQKKAEKELILSWNSEVEEL